jgi:pilus assembly protein CpaF
MKFDINEKAATNSVWGLLKDLATKSGITEVIINRPDNVYIERAGEFIRLNTTLDRYDIDSFIQDCADYNKKSFDETHPVLDGRLPDGSRLNVISDAFSLSCPAITIRKYLKNIKTFDTSKGIFGTNPKWITLLTALVHSKMNIIVSGGTGVGKTTFLNLLLQEVSPSERIITIEDTRELSFNLPNVVRLESRLMPESEGQSLSTRDLVKNTLRMRPDRIIIGEVRGGEVFDLLQAMNTGHEGSMGSIHANSPLECLNRMENLYLLAGYDVPVRAIRYQISTSIDFIIQVGRDKEGNRVVKQLTEVSSMEQDRITLQDIAKMVDGRPKFTGLVPQRIKDLMEFGVKSDFFMNN